MAKPGCKKRRILLLPGGGGQGAPGRRASGRPALALPAEFADTLQGMAGADLTPAG